MKVSEAAWKYMYEGVSRNTKVYEGVARDMKVYEDM